MLTSSEPCDEKMYTTNEAEMSYRLPNQIVPAFTTLGLKCSTKVFYCCTFRPQPMCMQQAPRLSMYSNWRGVPKGTTPTDQFGPHAVLGHDSTFGIFSIAKPVSSSAITGKKVTEEEMIMTNFYQTRMSVEPEFPHTIADRRITKASLLAEPTSYPTATCDIHHKTSNDGNIHMRDKGQRRFVCNSCGICWKKPSMLRGTTNANLPTCRLCNSNFKTRISWLTSRQKKNYKKTAKHCRPPVPTTFEDSLDQTELREQGSETKAIDMEVDDMKEVIDQVYEAKKGAFISTLMSIKNDHKSSEFQSSISMTESLQPSLSGSEAAIRQQTAGLVKDCTSGGKLAELTTSCPEASSQLHVSLLNTYTLQKSRNVMTDEKNLHEELHPALVPSQSQPPHNVQTGITSAANSLSEGQHPPLTNSSSISSILHKANAVTPQSPRKFHLDLIPNLSQLLHNIKIMDTIAAATLQEEQHPHLTTNCPESSPLSKASVHNTYPPPGPRNVTKGDIGLHEEPHPALVPSQSQPLHNVQTGVTSAANALSEGQHPTLATSTNIIASASGADDRMNNEEDEFGRPVCGICKRCFSDLSQLRLHSNIHYFEKPFRCDTCSVSFAARKYLQKHKRSLGHMQKFSLKAVFEMVLASDPKPFKCSECETEFRSFGHLAKHLRSKTHIEKLECAGKLPTGFFGEMERQDTNLNNVDVTNCNSALESLQQIALRLYELDPSRLVGDQGAIKKQSRSHGNSDDSGTKDGDNVETNSEPGASRHGNDNPLCLDTRDGGNHLRGQQRNKRSFINSTSPPPNRVVGSPMHSRNPKEWAPNPFNANRGAPNNMLLLRGPNVQPSSAYGPIHCTMDSRPPLHVTNYQNQRLHLMRHPQNSSWIPRNIPWERNPKFPQQFQPRVSGGQPFRRPQPTVQVEAPATLSCGFCGMGGFQTRESLQQHLNAHADIRSFICQICEGGFRTQLQLDAHLKMHEK